MLTSDAIEGAGCEFRASARRYAAGVLTIKGNIFQCKGELRRNSQTGANPDRLPPRQDADRMPGTDR